MQIPDALKKLTVLAVSGRMAEIIDSLIQAEHAYKVASDRREFSLDEFASSDILAQFKADTQKVFPNGYKDRTDLSWVISVFSWLVASDLDAQTKDLRASVTAVEDEISAATDVVKQGYNG